MIRVERSISVATADISALVASPQSRWDFLAFVLPSLHRTIPVGAIFAAGQIGVALLPLTAGAG